MKKSNKLLLGGFLIGLLLIVAIHITLYAKYKAGNYTVYNAEDDLTLQSMQSFPNILFVSVRNVPDVTVRFSDVAQVEKEEESIQYAQKGDTLLITGRDSAEQRSNGRRITVSLPYNVTLSAFNSFLSFQTGKKAGENNPVIYLQKANVLFSGTGSPLQFGHVKLVASNGSTATFEGNTQVGRFDVQLSNSSIEYTDGNFDQLTIVTDSLSRISLQAKHLLKANIRSSTPK